jgi:5-methylcytosine-specific restriction endonuclease McrA
MRFEIVIFLIVVFIIANMYTDGKYIQLVLSWKKYFQMFGVAFVGYMLCWLFRKNPEGAKTMIVASNEYLKYLPIDKNTSSFISPILDFTSKYDFTRGGNNNSVNNNMIEGGSNEKRIINSGKQSSKRSVSETKKKFVAAKQNWHCGNCRKQLPAWFEVDHTVRLEHGGSNHVDNLVALCRDCHGEKTAMENL